MAGYDRQSRGGPRPNIGGSTVKIEGLSDLESALMELPKAVGRGALRRALLQAGQPIADRAKQIVRRKTGRLADSIVVSTKAKSAGAAAYSEALSAGGSKQSAAIAFRSANREAKGAKSTAEVYIGPAGVRYSALIEFGTIHSPAFPYMRPAWAEGKDRALSDIQMFLTSEIDKAVTRLSAKALRLKAKG